MSILILRWIGEGRRNKIKERDRKNIKEKVDEWFLYLRIDSVKCFVLFRKLKMNHELEFLYFWSSVSNCRLASESWLIDNLHKDRE